MIILDLKTGNTQNLYSYSANDNITQINNLSIVGIEEVESTKGLILVKTKLGHLTLLEVTLNQLGEVEGTLLREVKQDRLVGFDPLALKLELTKLGGLKLDIYPVCTLEKPVEKSVKVCSYSFYRAILEDGHTHIE